MFVLNGTNGVQLWDMSSHQIISLKEIQSEVIGFYQYDSEENNFDLYLGIGDTKYANETVGATIDFGDFPTNWGAGADSHVRFSQRGTLQCNELCIGLGAYSAGQFLWDVTGYMIGTGGSPVGLTAAGLALVLSLAASYSPGNPLVTIQLGPLDIVDPSDLKFPTP